MATSSGDRVTNWNGTWALAVVFGLASIPWTYAFVAGLEIPLWPSFIASATFYAAGSGLDGLARGYASNAAGIAYAALTLAVVDGVLGGGAVALSVVVGVFIENAMRKPTASAVIRNQRFLIARQTQSGDVG